MLAYYYYPFFDNHNFTEYTKNDLTNPSKVEELFDYCQILEAYITKSGWEFLINYYGYEKLYEINKKAVGSMLKHWTSIYYMSSQT